MSVAEEEQHRWGTGLIDLRECSLPALKARRAIAALPLHLPAPRILDFGCGEGKFLDTLRGVCPPAELHGADVQRPLGATSFLFHDLAAGPPMEDASVDGVTALDVFEHVSDPETALERIRRMLRPGGVFHAFVPAEGEPLSGYALYRLLLGRDLYARTKDHVQAFRRKDVLRLIGRKLRIRDVSWSYHLLGAAMDSTFFAACAYPPIGRWWWAQNGFYHPEKRRSAASRVLAAANAVCYLESMLLAHVPWTAAGVHVTAVRGDD